MSANPPTVARQTPKRWIATFSLIVIGGAGLILSTVACARPSPSQPQAPLDCVEFVFRVRDAETGQPIEGAFIGHSNTQNRTDRDGNYWFALECSTEDGAIVYPDWTFTVSAPGYQDPGLLRLTAYTGARGNETRKQIEVALTRHPKTRPE